MRLLILLVLVALLLGSFASTPHSHGNQTSASYRGPLPGEKHALPQFHFSYESDWRNGEINNSVLNTHPTDRLHVEWPAGFIFRMHTPLPPKGGSDHIGFSASTIDRNDSAQLRYGLAADSQPAPVYQLPAGQSASRFPMVLRSWFRLVAPNPDDPPFILHVSSTYLEVDQTIIYSFIQNRDFDLAIVLPSDIIASFRMAGWVVMLENATRGIEGAAVLRDEARWRQQQMPDFELFPLLRAPELTSAVIVREVRPDAVETSPSFVLVADKETWIGTGVFLLHLPTTQR